MNAPTSSPPHRWKVLIFDDEILNEILDTNNLMNSCGLALSTPRAIELGSEVFSYIPGPENGYLVDFLAVRHVRSPIESLVDSKHPAHPELLSHLPDYAFLDWKDKAGEEPMSIGMGFQLGLALRQHNPRCVIVLQSAYSDEVDKLFEARVQRWLLAGEDGNRPRAKDLGTTSDAEKQSTLTHRWLVDQEMDNCLARFRSDREWLALREQFCAVLREIPERIRDIPQQASTIKKDRKEALALAKQLLAAELARPVGPLAPAYVYPFTFSAVIRQIQVPLEAAITGRRPFRKTRTELKMVMDAIYSILEHLAVLDAPGPTLIRELVKDGLYELPVEVQGTAHRVLRSGAHSVNSEPVAKAWLEAVNRRIEMHRVKSPDVVQGGYSDGIRRFTEAVLNLMLAMPAPVAPPTVEQELEGDPRWLDFSDQLATLAHAHFRMNPFQVIAQSFGLCPQLDQARSFRDRLIINFTPGTTAQWPPLVLDPSARWSSTSAPFIYSVRSHCETLLKSLATELQTNRNLQLGCVVMFLDADKNCARADFTFSYLLSNPANIERLLGGQNSGGGLLRELETYFAVAYGPPGGLLGLPALRLLMGPPEPGEPSGLPLMDCDVALRLSALLEPSTGDPGFLRSWERHRYE